MQNAIKIGNPYKMKFARKEHVFQSESRERKRYSTFLKRITDSAEFSYIYD